MSEGYHLYALALSDGQRIEYAFTRKGMNTCIINGLHMLLQGLGCLSWENIILRDVSSYRPVVS